MKFKNILFLMLLAASAAATSVPVFCINSTELSQKLGSINLAKLIENKYKSKLPTAYMFLLEKDDLEFDVTEEWKGENENISEYYVSFICKHEDKEIGAQIRVHVDNGNITEFISKILDIKRDANNEIDLIRSTLVVSID